MTIVDIFVLTHILQITSHTPSCPALPYTAMLQVNCTPGLTVIRILSEANNPPPRVRHIGLS